ncbi:ribonuclease P subunit p25 family protein [Metallosphaera hakonensis]|uniref:DNA-binding protein n=1 Tax=Metallosphaera hakonensis JCM 8857 = DSM 7519 TaxID=1293036 RepID=A0A2U9IV46_9CREN|nr:DNA-binding protein [Metallosphaera hakonensis]AWR99946.1 DNA-binding protein [Metallosphaera hakonensis JCM 8857 = DSM 7519]
MEVSQFVISRNKTIEDQVLDIISSFNHGVKDVELKGYGREMDRAADVYNILKEKLGDGVALVEVNIGSEFKDKRRVSYLLFRLRKNF